MAYEMCSTISCTALSSLTLVVELTHCRQQVLSAWNGNNSRFSLDDISLELQAFCCYHFLVHSLSTYLTLLSLVSTFSASTIVFYAKNSPRKVILIYSSSYLPPKERNGGVQFIPLIMVVCLFELPLC